MNQKTNIKFGEVNNLSDARYAAGCGAGFLGFNFNPENPKYLDPEKFKEIAGWVEGPILVAEWDDQPVDYILDQTEELCLEYIQLNKVNPMCSVELQSFQIIQNFYMDGCETIQDIIAHVDAVQKCTKYFLLSFRDANRQELFLTNPHNEIMLTEFCRDYPVILNFQWNKNNLLPIIEKYNPFGVNLIGSSEERTGVKDFDFLNDMVELLEM